MSVWKLYTVHCDGCSHWVDAGIGDTAKDARAGLRGRGWKLSVPDADPNVRSRRDFCARCVSEGRGDISAAGPR